MKILLSLITALAAALALYTNVGDAQVTASWAACSRVVDTVAPARRQFCESLKSGHLLWVIAFYASLVIAGIGGLALYLAFNRSPQ